MNALVKLLQEKYGLSPEVAQSVVQTVVGYIEQKMPGPMGASLKSLLGEGGPDAAAAASTESGSLMDKAKSMVEGVLGKKDA